MKTRIQGCLVGTAIGDALGLAAEGLSPRRQRRLYPHMPCYGLLWGRGIGSDDTDHACLTAQALIASGGEPAVFQRWLGRGLRRWFATLPFGIGLATLKACLKLCVGVSPAHSGVWSAGNGPAMRTPVLGVVWGHEPPRLRTLVRLATRVTHTDPKAEIGALAVALAAHWAAMHETVLAAEFAAYLTRELRAWETEGGTPQPALTEFLQLCDRVTASVTAGENTLTFAAVLGLERRGVSGYMYHTVPMALHAWLAHPRDYAAGMRAIILCGGDTDTAAAIAGGILGAGVGPEGIPEPWRHAFRDWPQSLPFLLRLGDQLADVAASGRPAPPLMASLPALWLRAALLDPYILLVGLRRLLPPW